MSAKAPGNVFQATGPSSVRLAAEHSVGRTTPLHLKKG